MAKLTSLQTINSNEVNLQDGLYLAHRTGDDPETYEDRRININKLAGALPTEDIKYDNTESGLTASDVQGAIDELAAGGREVLPDPPAADGTYTLQCTVLNGVATYAWV